MSLLLYSFPCKTRVQKFLPEHCHIIKQQSNGEKWYGFIFVLTFAVFAPSLCFSTFYFLLACIRPCDTNTIYICGAKTRWAATVVEASFKLGFVQSLSTCPQCKISRSVRQFFLLFCMNLENYKDPDFLKISKAGQEGCP